MSEFYGIFLAFAKAMLDVLPEDGPMGTETCRSFMEFFSILMCVNMF